jgi:ribonuclease HI
MSIDRALASRLSAALSAIAEGTPTTAALKNAGVTPEQVRRLLRDLDAALRSEVAGNVGGTGTRSSTAGRLEEAVVNTDGGSRGNPGEAACAVVLHDGKGEEFLRRAKRLGVATNNQAEYEGAIYALELAAQLGARRVVLRTDSELVARQLTGDYKVKNEGLKPYHARARELMSDFERVTVTHVPRAENKIADKLVNACLDGKELPED